MALGTIQTGTGLATGMDISGTVDKLMALNAKPRDLLKTATENLKTEKTALTTLAALLYAIKVPTTSLGKASVYQERAATSSLPNVLAATVSGNPAIGSYEYTPLRMATNQKLLSSGFASDSLPIGTGKMTIRFGDRVDRNAALGAANGGTGLVRGSMRITDSNGSTADIDLSTAQTVDDVLDAINGATTIDVTATTVNGHIHLVDNTNGSANLKVQEIGSGKTAASLGLAGIDSATGVADGQDILKLYNGITLSSLNDGLGVEISTTLEDISYTLRDGTTGNIDFAHHDNLTSSGSMETTLQQLMDEVNTQSGGKLKLSIAADGVSLAMTDTTTGSGSFTMQSAFNSLALHDLGLDGASVDGVIAGRRILGGLKSVSLGSLNGGKGLGTLGTIALTDRLGGRDKIDLQNAQTLDDVIGIINASTTVKIHAQVNAAGNGIELVDVSGSSTGSMAIADADATNTATKLNIKTAADATSLASVNSGDMHLKVIGENTLLSSLNGGAGMASGRFTITNAKGDISTIDLTSTSIKTVGDVIRAINRQGNLVHAELNSTGDGILLRDSGGGKGAITVADSGGTTAKSLGLLKTSTTTTTTGEQQIDGSMTYVVNILDKDTLANLNAQINGVGGGISSSIIADSSAMPYHLSITSGRTGKAGSLVIDTTGVNFSVDEITKAQDSLILLGPQSAKTTAVLTSSSSNTYSNLTTGLKLNIKQATGETVLVNVTSANSSLSAGVKVFVENFNKFWDELTKDTTYDLENNKASTLTADATTFNFQTQMANLLSGSFLGAGKFTSLADLGITFTPDGSGHLQFDATVLQNAVDEEPDAVKNFFTTKDTGFADKIGNLIEELAGVDKSMLENRLEALQKKIDDNNTRIEKMNTRLDKQKEVMLLQFYNMDLAVSKSQTSLKSLESIAWMASNLYGNSSSSSSSSG
jgi:flagellar hook-associated protein 2